MNLKEKYQYLSVQAKATIWFTMCSFIQKGISFITVPIFTRLMSTEQYGIYTVYLSWLQILTILTSLYLFNGVYDNAMVKFEEHRDEYTSSMQGLTFVITSIIFVLFCCTSSVWENIIGLPKILIILMFIEALVTPALSYWSGRQRFEYRYKLLVVVTLLQALLNPIISLILISVIEKTALVRIIGIVFVQSLICCPIIIIQFVKGKKFYCKTYWNYALKIGIPILPHYLSGMVLNQGDRIMIDKMVGKTEVALYGLAYSIGMLVQLFVTGLNSAITPWMYKKIKNHDIGSMRKVLHVLVLCVAGIAIMLMLVSPELVLVFGSSKYQTAVYVIPPVAASVFFIFLYGILSLPQFYYEKTQFLMVASIIAAGVNVILNLIFIKLFGYVAAGYTTLVCYIVYSLGHYIVSLNVLRANGETEQLLNGKLTILISCVLVLVSIICNFIFPYRVIRYAILLFLTLIVLIKRNYLINIIVGLRKGN